MFEYLKGTLIEASPSSAVVDVGGIGYSLLIPVSHYSKLPACGSQIIFYTSFVVREDSHRLYGFLTRQEKELFNTLNDVSGIGPKTALALLGHLEMEDLQLAISESNISLICKTPGIGKKTAERLVLDLRDKMKAYPLAPEKDKKGPTSDALSALIHLGYHPSQAQKAIKAALAEAKEPPPLAKLITLALRHI